MALGMMLNVGPLPLAARPCAGPQPPASFLPSGSTPPSLQPRGLVTEACPGMLFPSVFGRLPAAHPDCSPAPSCSLPFCPPPGRGPGLLSPDFFFVIWGLASIRSLRSSILQELALPNPLAFPKVLVRVLPTEPSLTAPLTCPALPRPGMGQAPGRAPRGLTGGCRSSPAAAARCC